MGCGPGCQLSWSVLAIGTAPIRWDPHQLISPARVSCASNWPHWKRTFILWPFPLHPTGSRILGLLPLVLRIKPRVPSMFSRHFETHLQPIRGEFLQQRKLRRVRDDDKESHFSRKIELLWMWLELIWKIDKSIILVRYFFLNCFSKASLLYLHQYWCK